MMKRLLLYVWVMAAVVAVAGGCSEGAKEDDVVLDVDGALAYCHSQVLRSLRQMRDADGCIDFTMMPRCVVEGDSAWTLRRVEAQEWCSGFYPGILWMDYAASGDSVVRRAALEATAAMGAIVDAPVFDHDLGFLIYCSAGTGLRVLGEELANEGLSAETRAADEEAVALCRELCLRAADSLATLYRPRVGTILSWPRATAKYGGHNTIMDNMLNLEMLLWAADEGGLNPEHADSLRQMALSHAETTLRHHFREDGSSYHVAVYDSVDGHFLRGVTHQGLADSSTWARGQAWAVYGFTMMARETGRADFLERACLAADVFLDHLPADGVPFWDFCDPRIATSRGDMPEGDTELTAPRDASAGAVVASALVELSTLVADADVARRYSRASRRMLAALSSESYWAGASSSAFLLHSTGNWPRSSEVDVPIVYADYYYLEALERIAPPAGK